jgi:hypothetical protein
VGGRQCSVSGLRLCVDQVAPLREGLCKLIYPVPRYGDYAPTEYSKRILGPNLLPGIDTPSAGPLPTISNPQSAIHSYCSDSDATLQKRQSRVWVCRTASRVLQPKTGFQRDRKSRKVPEAFRRKWLRNAGEDSGRWLCGGLQACDTNLRAAFKQLFMNKHHSGSG